MSQMKVLRNQIAWKATAPSILLVINSFVWYIFTYAIFYSIVTNLNMLNIEKIGLFTTYYMSLAISAILGSKFISRIRIPSLNVWPFMGAIATLSLMAISNNNMLVNASFALFLGASVGIGLPSCLSYFADSTKIESRGSAGGIAWSIVGLSVLMFAFLTSITGQWETIAALTIWRFAGGLSFLVLNRKHKNLGPVKAISYLKLIHKREILLYLFPWLMFCLINFAEAPVLEKVFGDEFALVQVLEYAVVGVVAVVAGSVADIAGRKRIVIAGFIMLGIEYAALSVFANSATMYLFLVLDGITWGLLFSVFFMAVWGDLGESYAKEKYYTLGGLPFLLAGFLSILIKPLVSGIDSTAAFSFASFFLFLAVLPLMYAPDTLPEKIMKKHELENYIEKAQKEATKAHEKESKTGQSGDADDGVEIEANPDLEEILKEAEKYY